MAASADRQLILGILASQGTASSPELQAATGKSQPTISRVLAELGPQVLKIGRARAARYALGRLIHGRSAQHALWWTDVSGDRHQVGTLTHLANEAIYVHSPQLGDFQGRALPWYLTPLKAEGFLGRLAAKRFASMGIDNDPDRWSLETVLYAALQVHDAPGAMTLGLQDAIAAPLQLPSRAAAKALDKAAADVSDTLPAGSSAGGEQPKFLAILDDGRHVIVKFTPPLQSPGGQRWADLLHAEDLAAKTLDAHGVASASTQIVRTKARTYLVSQRFDRIGASGRRHAVSIGKVHEAFVQGAYRNWAETASALTLAGRLPNEAAGAASIARDFGRLIGNTDMHSGNLGLFVEQGDVKRGRFQLAPVYDMLPMRYRPNAANGGVDDYTAFTLDAVRGPAATIAAEFWERLAAVDAVSAAMRELAGKMTGRVRALVRGR